MVNFFVANCLRISARGLVCFFCAATLSASDVSYNANKTLTSESSEVTITKINQVASEITVKIWDKDFLGSGIIVHKQGNNYTIVTNQHVLRGGSPPYQVQTPDGKFHQAKMIPNVKNTEQDLALLTFEAKDQSYKIARIGQSSSLEVGQYVFAAGFPINQALAGFSFTIGRISLILDQPLETGYQIGATNNVQKGMSGGPLLNEKGELVGVNGKHAYPLWEAVEFYEDGSQPCSPIQNFISKSSWAIPIEKVIELQPQLQLQPVATDSENITSTLLSLSRLESKEYNPIDLIAQMQAEAESTKNCQILP